MGNTISVALGVTLTPRLRTITVAAPEKAPARWPTEEARANRQPRRLLVLGATRHVPLLTPHKDVTCGPQGPHESHRTFHLAHGDGHWSPSLGSGPSGTPPSLLLSTGPAAQKQPQQYRQPQQPSLFLLLPSVPYLATAALHTPQYLSAYTCRYLSFATDLFTSNIAHHGRRQRSFQDGG